MDVIKGHQVVGGKGFPIAPGPADGDAGVIEIMDQIMGEHIAGGLANPDPDGAVEHFAPIVDMTVAHLDRSV